MSGTLRRVWAIALTAATVVGVTGCAEVVVGTGEAGSEVTELSSVTMDDITLPKDDFYGDSVEVSDNPDDAYQRICDSGQTFDLPEGVESKVRQVNADPPSVVGDDASIYVDETVLIFPDPKSAEEFVAGFDDVAESCPSEDSTSEVIYTYAQPTKYDKAGWRGWSSEITLDIGPGDTEGSEVDTLAYKGNVVGYASWLADPVDDQDLALSEIHTKIDEFFSTLIGGS